jgi:hypothetical protein
VVGIVPHVPAAAADEPAVLDELPAELAVLDDWPALDWLVPEELDEPDEQAARPRPAARARAAMPPGCTALIDVSFDTVIAKSDPSHRLRLSYSERARVPRVRPEVSGRPGQTWGQALPRPGVNGCGRRVSRTRSG